MTDPDESDVSVPRRWPVRPPRMGRVDGPPASWPVPRLPTPARLADWLGIPFHQLDWFADLCGWNDGAKESLRHYTLRWLRKPSGAHRLLEVPKPRLKRLQRRLLDGLLAHIPPHEAAHGYRPGRSVVSFAAPHAGRRLVLRLDLCDFFPSVRASRVHALFHRLGYPCAVARLLTGLCTHAVPPNAWPPAANGRDDAARQRFAERHLPQGAPTSPALANLCAWRLDARLTALAADAGAVYTRYADDLAFSGDRAFERAAARFQVQVMRVALEEGFEVNARKSRFMRAALRQQLCGVVVNDRPNVARRAYDQLKAVLHNCARHGPASQNRAGHAEFRAHLLGRIAWVARLNPARGARLRAAFDRIAWETP